MKKPTKRNGFTLVELIIVIAILAILATVGLQVFGGIQENARKTVALDDAAKVAGQLNLYYMSLESIPVADRPSGAASGIIAGAADTTELIALFKQMKTAQDNGTNDAKTAGIKWPALKNSTNLNSPENDDRRALKNIWYDVNTSTFKAKSKSFIDTAVPAAVAVIGKVDSLNGT